MTRPDIAFRVIDVREATWSHDGIPVVLEVAIEQPDKTFRVIFTGDYSTKTVDAAIKQFINEHYHPEESPIFGDRFFGFTRAWGQQ